MALYRNEDGIPMLYLARVPYNLVFNNHRQVMHRLFRNGRRSDGDLDEGMKRFSQGHTPGRYDIKRIIEAESTVGINLLQVELRGTNVEGKGYFSVSVNDDERALTKAERVLVQRAYGQAGGAMTNLEIAKALGFFGICRIDVYMPDYITNRIPDGKALANGCTLRDDESGCYFDATFVINSFNTFLRGRPIKPRASDKTDRTIAKHGQGTPDYEGKRYNAFRHYNVWAAEQKAATNAR